MVKNNSKSESEQRSFPFESLRPLSKSKIWQLNHEFYASEGVGAWSKGTVPHQITSNSKVGKTYAEIIYGFLLDVAAKGGMEETIYILELGAGHGRLAYHLIKHLNRLIEQSQMPLPNYCYILSDIGESNLNFFSDHPQLQDAYDEGRLDLAYYDFLQTKKLELRKSGVCIEVNALHQPLVVIANYFFDSIPSEIFRIKSGAIYNCEVALSCNADPASLETKNIIDELKIDYTITPQASPYYQDELYNQILNRYKVLVSDTFLLFPDISMAGLEHLNSFSSSGMLVLSMDKGHHLPTTLDHTNAPELVSHGSVSFQVNYHALGLHCTEKGGQSWFPSMSNLDLNVVGLLYLKDCGSFPNTRLAYDRYVEDFGPYDYNTFKNFGYEQSAEMTTQQVIALIKLSSYDPALLSFFLPRIKSIITHITYNERQQIHQTLLSVGEMYFWIGENKDLCFEIGGLMYALGYYQSAITQFDRSEVYYGTTPDGLYNKALCYYQLRQDDLFEMTRIKAKKLFPNFENFSHLDALDLEAS